MECVKTCLGLQEDVKINIDELKRISLNQVSFEKTKEKKVGNLELKDMKNY